MALLALILLGCREDPVAATPSVFGFRVGLVVLDEVTVIDVHGAREGRAVVLDGDRILEEREAGGPWPFYAQVYTGGYLVPGLMDSHVHLAHSGTLDWVGDTLPDNLRASLWHGVTTVVDVGGPTSLFSLRDGIADGAVLGPQVLATGPFLTTPGSHPCEAAPNPELCQFVDADTAEAAARALHDAGADGIKVALADAAFTDWPTPRLDPEAIRSASGVLPVIAHVDADADVIDAVAAGADQLAHPPFAAPVGDAALMAAVSVPVHTTVGAFAAVGDLVEGRLNPDDPTLRISDSTRESWRAVQEDPTRLLPGWLEASAAWAAQAEANLGALHVEGAALLPGSDAGYYFVAHGSGLHAELAGLVRLGYTPEEALVAATWTPRQVWGLEGGEIAVGAPADLLVLGDDPRLEVAALDRIQWVIRAGRVWSRAELGSTDLGEPADSCWSSEHCATGERCDPFTRGCADACPTPGAVTGVCDADSWCMASDGAGASDGVCHEEPGCDLYTQDCEPAWYGQACVPMDIDTNLCWPAGGRRPGQSCDASEPTQRCVQGSFCSTVDSRCWELCDPDAETCGSGRRCYRQHAADGTPWFGVCDRAF